MSNSDLIQISVLVAGRSYPLKVKADDQEVIAEIAEDVNKRIRDYQETYPNREKQDWLSMAILSYAIEKYQTEKTINDAKLVQKVTNLEAYLDTLIQ